VALPFFVRHNPFIFLLKVFDILPNKSKALWVFIYEGKRNKFKQSFQAGNTASSRKRHTHREVGAQSHGSGSSLIAGIPKEEKNGGMGPFFAIGGVPCQTVFHIIY
jgi:hypothetical protein